MKPARISKQMFPKPTRLLCPLACALLVLSTCLATVPESWAQPVDVPPTWGGDFSSRPRLTGSWGGLRDELGKKGVVLDVDMLGTPQGAMSGGRDTGWEFWGTSEYTLNVDTQKMGLWPGGFLNVYGMSSFGQSVNHRTGALVPVNTALLLPKPFDTTSALMNLSFMQFFNPHVGIVVGKLYTLGGDDNAFAHNHRSDFMNTALDFNMALAMFPFSAYGGSLIVLPWDGAQFTAAVIDPSGTTTDNDISKAFKDGVLVSSEGRVEVKPFGLVGHQLLGMGWSNKDRTSLQQDPSNIARLLLDNQFPRLANPGPILKEILERRFPALLVPTQPLNHVANTWGVYYNFDQYLWSPAGDPTKGIGVFFRFGISDGVANPIKNTYNVGISGNGIVPGRPLDKFGIGWARTQFSNNFVPFLRQQLDLGLNKEDAVEMYYNAALTQWLNASLDLQVINPALNKQLQPGAGILPTLVNMDTAVVMGFRMYVRF
jgi:porin